MANSATPVSYDPSEVFSAAMKFHTACNVLARIDPEKENSVAAAVMIPNLAMSALAIELFLKTLHALQSTNPVPQNHNLAGLYRGLTSATQTEIQKAWDPIFAEMSPRWLQIREINSGEKRAPMNPSVEVALEEGSQAFERYRYAFDMRKGDLPNYYVDQLRPPLIQMLLLRRPEWGAWGPRLKKTETTPHQSGQNHPPEGGKSA